MIKAVVFDMDGTILNTLDDLADGVNYAMRQRGYQCNYDKEIVGMFFGSGIRVAFERALAVLNGCGVDELELLGTADYDGQFKADVKAQAEIDELMKIYVPYYKAHCNDKTCAYDGILDLLDEFRKKGIKTAVVSNKPDAAVKILCRDLFDGYFDYNLGELEGVNRKPDRAMVDMAIKALGVDVSEAVYVGDSEIDLLTAKNSDLPCIAVTWGFRGRAFLEKHGAKIIIDRPEEILEIIKNET